jgi:hypothetical protein
MVRFGIEMRLCKRWFVMDLKKFMEVSITPKTPNGFDTVWGLFILVSTLVKEGVR